MRHAASICSKSAGRMVTAAPNASTMRSTFSKPASCINARVASIRRRLPPARLCINPGKRGRGTDQTPVLVGVSLNKQGAPQYVKMQVIPDIKGKTLVEFAKQHIEPGSTISSDAYRSYNALAEEYNHQPIKFNVKDDPDHLKWLHTMISNAKAFIGGTFHGLDSKHLQSYLSEFCFRTNRRQFEGQMFNRLLAACVSTDTVIYSELTA